MNTRPLGVRFGLIALALSLFASAAFAGNTPAPTQVVVTNPPAQPVPMIGLITDTDAPARKPFQWYGSFSWGAGGNEAVLITTVPDNQRLVVEDVSGYCQGNVTHLDLDTFKLGKGYTAWHYLSAAFWNGTGPASTPVRFYADPGSDLNFAIFTSAESTCNMAVSGYFVNLP